MDLDADVTMIHDPQPVGLVAARPTGATWIWRCHIDLSSPQRAAWDVLKPSVAVYDATVFHMAQFARRLAVPQYLIHPSIDPLAPKNRELPPAEIERRLSALGVPFDRPLVVQVSGFDSFKDPLGGIEAYRLVRRFRDAVLVLAGGLADDDPEGQVKPVIGGAAGGIAAQIEDGVTGLLVHSVQGTAYALRRLLGDQEPRTQMGALAREHARRNSLVTRHLVDCLLLLRLHLLAPDPGVSRV